jgi:hypothetical protein
MHVTLAFEFLEEFRMKVLKKSLALSLLFLGIANAEDLKKDEVHPRKLSYDGQILSYEYSVGSNPKDHQEVVELEVVTDQYLLPTRIRGKIVKWPHSYVKKIVVKLFDLHAGSEKSHEIKSGSVDLRPIIEEKLKTLNFNTDALSYDLELPIVTVRSSI